jgi:death-on-curing family protein
MCDIFESINSESFKKYLQSLNILVGESGNVIDIDRLLGISASYHYYADTRSKISSIVRGIVKNHPFVDGNKRTALVFFLLMSKLGNFQISLNHDQLEEVFVNIAKNNYTVEEIVKLLYSDPTVTEQLREWINILSK